MYLREKHLDLSGFFSERLKFLFGIRKKGQFYQDDVLFIYLRAMVDEERQNEKLQGMNTTWWVE